MSSNQISFSLGADPEFFITDKFGNVKSIVGKLGGTKEYPKYITETKEGFAIQEDNVAAEYNIPATHNKKHFYGNIRFPQDAIRTILGTNDYSISYESAVSFPDAELNTPESWIFGCEPDYDAWNMCENIKPHAKDKNLRTAGGHVHVGVPLDNTEEMVELVKAMDLHLGVWSVIADKTGEKRRELYGKAGAFRPKPYGLEYRVLSNFWIFNEDHCNKVWDLTERSIAFVKAKKKLDKTLGEEIQRCINTGDKNVATSLKTYWL